MMKDMSIETTALLVGLIFVIVSIIMLAFPPKKINGLYGYRTSASMKSQKHWDFAQRFSSFRMIEAGIFLLGFSFASNYFGINPVKSAVGTIVLLLASTLYLILRTEIALKKKFPN
ncbi:MAG: SdpI family protein [Flavobacterium sp.]|uniref:SdpI family protein n=1 Tax=Flavobacterium sp. TaxID=239 RepID=UPI0011F81760|nr:SdpI family protein [Flavobacterium sp.]RZJ67926.1 MAG: SdpI family protein [Flavobacterium sp.]